MQPLFSVLIPTTGKLGLLELSIKSVLEQEGIPTGDLEIVVADASKVDIVGAIVGSFKDSCLRYVEVPDRDPSIGWDFAYKQSRGKYILWFDDDDYMLPGALKMYADVIRRTGADVVTSQHLYYYDRAHPRRDRRESLGVIFFDGKESFLKPRDAMSAIMAYKIGSKELPFRLRSGSTFFARAVCEAAERRLGNIVLPHMRTSHSLQAILYPFATSCVAVSIPTVIVGRLGNSMTQSYRNVQSGAAKKKYDFKYSPVHGDLLQNHIAESYLMVQKLLADKYAGIPFQVQDFVMTQYLRELFYSAMDFKTERKLWKEVREFAEALPGDRRDAALAKVTFYSRAAVVAAPFKFLGIWITVKDTYRALKEIPYLLKRKKRKKIGLGERTIKLKQYGINDIAALARHARDILLKETGRDITLYEPTLTRDDVQKSV